jgi:hypothetical protein
LDEEVAKGQDHKRPNWPPAPSSMDLDIGTLRAAQKILQRKTLFF